MEGEMEQVFVDRFMGNKSQLESAFKAAHPDNYRAVVKAVCQVITSDDYGDIDPERIHEIDDGDYQGTLVYVIAATGYQPDDYWYVRVGYGSCSGCDTLEAIKEYSDEPPTDDQVAQYMPLALHIVQGLRKMGGEEA